MAAQACAGFLRWSWKTSLLKGVPVLESPRMLLPSLHRWFCSSQHDPSVPTQSVKHHDGELTKQSLADMGFSESQADAVYEGAAKHRCKRDMRMLTVLFSLGFNPDSVLKILEKCPALYSLNETQLQQRITNLRKLGLLEGSLQRVISHYPMILTLPVKRVNAVSRLLREKCKFTAQQVTDVLRDSPHVVEEEPGRLEYMFQYVYFRMGCSQAEVVKSKLFRLTLEELRCRHTFLERRGLYQTPDKKGQTLILNPNLKDILTVTEETFLARVATATQEEFDVFRKLIAREQEEEYEWEEEYSSDEDDKDDVDDEEADDHSQKHTRNTGYKKRKNQRKEN